MLKQLELDLKIIFDVKKVVFDTAQYGEEQDVLFCSLDDVKSETRDNYIFTEIQGSVSMIGATRDKLQYGYLTKKVNLMPKNIYEKFVFAPNEVPIDFGTSNRIFGKYSIGFTYFTQAEYNPKPDMKGVDYETPYNPNPPILINDHNKLFNRDIPKQHPIDAIDGLRESLDKKANANSVYTKDDADNKFATKTELETERQERINDVTDLNNRVDSVVGKLTYLPPYNFGTSTPTQEVLTDYALSHRDTLINSLSVQNLFDNHEWIYNEDGNEWIDNGIASVATATNSSLGVVKGSDEDFKGSINEKGEIEVNKLKETLDSKANTDLANTDFITDCVLSAVNGIVEYSSGKNITVKSGIDILFSNGRKTSRVFNNIRFKKEQDSTIILSGSSGDKITIFIDQTDGSIFQALSSKVYKGVKAPEDYTYFKNINTNFWQKKGAENIPWTAGFGFNSYSCQSKVMFNGVLYLSMVRRYQSSFSYFLFSTIDGKTYTQVSSENWGSLASANGLFYSSTKGVTSDLISFRTVTFPSASPTVYGKGEWFYLFSSSDKKFHKTKDFIDYIELVYPVDATNAYTTGFDVDDEENIIVTLSTTVGYTEYPQNPRVSKDGGNSWESPSIANGLGTATKIANGVWAIGCSTGTLAISSNKGETWTVKTISSSRIRSIEFGQGEWQAAISTALLVVSHDNFTTFEDKNTGFTVGGYPSLIFGNGLFFMTDLTTVPETGIWTSNSYIAYAQPASADEIITVTDIVTCEIDSSGNNLINIQPKYPVDLLNMFDVSELWSAINDINKRLEGLV